MVTHIGAGCCFYRALSNSPNHTLSEEKAEELGNGWGLETFPKVCCQHQGVGTLFFPSHRRHVVMLPLAERQMQL